MRNKKSLKDIFPILILLVLAVSLIVIFGLVERLFDRVNAPPASLTYSESGEQRVLYNDAWYVRDDNVETLLALGIDSIELPDGSRDDSAQADFIALLVIDLGQETFRILHINRDTMTDINQLDENDKNTTYSTPNWHWHIPTAVRARSNAAIPWTPWRIFCTAFISTTISL